MNQYVLGAALLAVFLADPAFAQAYPSKPIRLIVPFAAGGGNDNVARLVGKRLADSLGQPVVVDNRPGAGGVLGAELAARSAADGYTLFLGGVGSHAINPNLNDKLPYDPIRDFAPVELLAQAPLVLVVHPSVPARSFAEFVAYARANPGRLNYASNGNGSSSQLAAVMFDSMAGVDMVHVPYKGLSPALADLLSGQVQLMFSSVVAILPHVKAGKLRALAVTGAKRSAELPEVPAVAESGYKGFDVTTWYGLLFPAGTPEPVVKLVNGEVNRVLKLAEVRSRLAAEGGDVLGGTPAEFAAVLKTDLTKWGQIVKQSGAKVD